MCAEKLRKPHSMCKTIQVFIQSNRLIQHEEQYSNGVVKKLPFPISFSFEIFYRVTVETTKPFRINLNGFCVPPDKNRAYMPLLYIRIIC